MKRLTLPALATLSLWVSASAGSVSNLHRVSFYTASARETDATPLLGYCKLGGSYRLPGNAIGLSPDLLRVYPCGTWVRVTSRGRTFVGIVADKTNGRYGRTADIRVASRNEAIRLGVGPGRIERLR